MKICHITSMHYALDTRIFEKECKSLVKIYDVSLIAPNIEDCEKDGIKIYGVKTKKNRISNMLNTRPFIKRALEIDADIYHAHDPELMQALLKLKKKGKKIVFDYHENYTEYLLTKEWIPSGFRSLFSHAFAYYERKCLPYYDAVITVTPYIAKRLSKYNERVHIITNYPKLHTFIDHRQWGRRVCFVGGIIPEWMLLNVVKSFMSIDGVFSLAGRIGSNSLFKSMQELESWSKVNYSGVLPYDKVIDYMQTSSAGLAVSTYNDPNACYKEGTLGVNKLFEYMMAGIPVIASDLTIWKEIVDKYECGICVDPNDVDSISKAIKYVFDNPEEAKRMGDNGRYAAQTKYNWGTQEKALYAIYDNLCSTQK